MWGSFFKLINGPTAQRKLWQMTTVFDPACNNIWLCLRQYLTLTSLVFDPACDNIWPWLCQLYLTLTMSVFYTDTDCDSIWPDCISIWPWLRSFWPWLRQFLTLTVIVYNLLDWQYLTPLTNINKPLIATVFYPLDWQYLTPLTVTEFDPTTSGLTPLLRPYFTVTDDI